MPDVADAKSRAANFPQRPPDDVLLLTVQQTAYLLGCSVRKVRSLIASRKLRDVSFDSRPRLRRSDVERFVG